MTAVLSPNPRQRFCDSSGNPLSGGKVYTYAANSSTLKATYTDATGATPNSNPVILDANGEADIWLPSDTAYKFRLTDTNDVTQWTVDNISVSSSQTVTNTQWTAPGFTPTYVTGTSFSVAGDKRDTFQVNRRTQATCTAGTLYGTITDSSYANNVTTVTVVMDSGALDNGLSVVNVGMLTPLSDALPRVVMAYYGVAGGAADAVTVTLSPIPPALADGLLVGAKIASANATTTPTLNTNSLGAHTVTKYGGKALAPGDLQAGHEALFRYDATNGNWELLNPYPQFPHGKQIFTANGTFIPEIDTIWVSGAGGGGGGSNATNGVGGGGGDSCLKKQVTVTVGQAYTATIGQGGAGSTASGGAGSDGGTTSLGTILTLAGGKGGSGNGTPGAAGGSGGTSGSLGMSISGVGNAGGNGGDTLLGSGGRCASWGGAGGNGSGYGSGGAGTGSAGVTGGSGAGAPGVLIIEW